MALSPMAPGRQGLADGGGVAGARPPGRFSSNVRWTLLGSAANSAGTWLLIVILARASGPAAVGDYALALALTAPVMAFAGLQMRTLLASDPAGLYAYREYLRVTHLSAGAGVLACLLLALALDGGGWVVLAAVCVMRVADAVGDVQFGLWQRAERMRVIGTGRVHQALASIAAVGAASALGAGSAGAAAAGALGSVVMVAYVHRETRRDALLRALAAPGRTEWPRLRALALQGLPLGLIVLLGALQSNVPRYFVERHAGPAALGLFAAASQLTSAGNILVGAVGMAALPRLATALVAGRGALLALTWRLCLAGAGLGVAGVALSAALGREVLSLVYRPEFGEASEVLLVLSAAAGLSFVASFLGYALTAARIIAIQPVLLVATLAVMVALCLVLVPAAGAVGAAWALVGGSAAQALASALALLLVPPGAGAAAGGPAT